YIPVRKMNYAVSGGNVTTYDDLEEFDDQQFIVHGLSINAAQNMLSEERTADKDVSLSSEEQALHDELVSLMHQESIAKIHNDAQRNAFEEEKRRISLEKGKESANSTFTLSTANTPPQNTEEGGAADYNNMDPIIDVTSTPTLRIHKIHPQSQIIGKKEPKKVSQALADKSWVEAMQEELLQFKLQEVWVLCDLPNGKRVIGTKWVFRNKRDERCLMYLTASRPDIMFAVCLCARFQVTPKVSHLHAVKRIFSDYARDNHDRRSTSGGCQYLGRRLVSWQCKKQTIMAISSTEAEYVAAASCCAQVLW
ncbi:hypothetical protein Tco_0043604, partial [Tanacetum coccineum]